MPRVLLGDVAREYKEACKGSKAGYPIVGLEHLIPKDIYLTQWSEDTENTFTKMFRKGNVLFGRRRAYLKKAAMAPFDGICSGDITVIEAIPGKILPELLPFIIQNDNFFKYAVGKSAGSLSPRVKWEYLKNYEFRLPDLQKQKPLAEILWAMDNAKQSYQKLIKATDELVKSQFVDMFKNDRFPVTTIGAVTEPKIERISRSFDKEDIIYYIDISSVDIETKSVTGYTKVKVVNAPSRAQYVLKKGDILYSTVRPNLQTFAVNPYEQENVVGSTGYCILRCKTILREYLWGVLLSDDFTTAMIKQSSGANYPAVNDRIVKSYEILFPPIELQQRFASIVHQSDKSKSELEQALSELTATYKRIIAENLG